MRPDVAGLRLAEKGRQDYVCAGAVLDHNGANGLLQVLATLDRRSGTRNLRFSCRRTRPEARSGKEGRQDGSGQGYRALEFDGCGVTGCQRLGAAGEASRREATSTLAPAVARSRGHRQRALDEATKYAAERKASDRDRPIPRRQVMLANAKTRGPRAPRSERWMETGGCEHRTRVVAKCFARMPRCGSGPMRCRCSAARLHPHYPVEKRCARQVMQSRGRTRSSAGDARECCTIQRSAREEGKRAPRAPKHGTRGFPRGVRSWVSEMEKG